MGCLNYFSLEHDNPALFRTAQWGRKGRVSLPYICYRAALALFFGVTYAVLWIMSVYPSKWLIYLTNQGLLLLVLHYTLDLLLSLRLFLKQRSTHIRFERPGMRVLDKLSWILANASSSIALMITIFFWIFLFDGENTFDNTFLHLLNSVSVLVDLIIIARPTRLAHMIHPILFGLFYLIFSVSYWAAGGTDPSGNDWIYPMVDWDNPGLATGVAFGCIAGVMGIHSVIHCLTLLRRKMSQKIRGNSEESIFLNSDF